MATGQERFREADLLGPGFLEVLHLHSFRGHDFGELLGITDRKRKGPLLALLRRSPQLEPNDCHAPRSRRSKFLGYNFC